MHLPLCLLLLLAAVDGKKKKPTVQASSSPSVPTCSAAIWSATDRQGILDNHNTLRSKIAKGVYLAKTDKKPAARDMETMTYDCNVESSAQAWANTCPTGHSGAVGKGENIYWSYSTQPLSITGKGVAASSSWQNEFQLYGWLSNNLTYSLFNSGIGHATQMAWWNSNKIGCGVKQCPSSVAGFQYEVVVVCQYTPQGNIINTNIYDSGTTCSGCVGAFKAPDCANEPPCTLNMSTMTVFLSNK